MAPIKFEENIREKLQERELQPNKDSWDALSKKLGHAPVAKNNRRMWMAVAAGFMGILLVVSYVLTSGNESQPVQLVDEHKTIPVEIKEVIKTTPLKEQAPILNTEIASETNENTPREQVKEQQQIVIPKKEKVVAKVEVNSPLKKKDIELESLQEEVIIANNTTKVKEDPKQNPLITKEELFVNTKIEDVVAKVREMEATNNDVTAEEIDKLLLMAQRDISTNRILASSKTKIDPSALLEDVESELERSFRDKVFEALGEGYNKVRTAVVKRNN